MSYSAEIAALTDITSGQTLAEAGHAARHNELNDAARALAGRLDMLGTAAALTIVELSGGGWSADAPAGRTDGQFPITFVPLDPADPSDPGDATVGIDTPANIRSWDLLGPVQVDSL
jgi:hypothetical protein